eukprot:TRINITY_DN21904_c0_g1_i1.p1 TRINITY_DN21904_c0_g1~~TRINITY_DN21904_c0_g1_i1.p1  ORF type:complete len:1089 (-),score=185.87 TRINITY_DN21904_c0_g1_i1:100-3366(-)
MQPKRSLWSRVPGYDSDDESDSDGVQVHHLGESWQEHPVLNFVATPSRSKKDPAPQGRGPSSSAPCFKIDHTDAPVVRDTLMCNGLVQTTQKDWLIQWSGPGMRDSVYQELNEFQRVNHFPGSSELTRKDRLWMNFTDMAQTFGDKDFDFVPQTFVLPEQVQEFLECYNRVGGLWIVKPHASSRGRGIFVLRDVSELPLNEVSVVSQYVENPLLIQGLKFDLRVYVLVTGYDPLRAYIYREGLVRFATKPYSTEAEHLSDSYRHLTNYSINKAASNFVENSQLKADNVGHKWSISALNRHLKCVGVDAEHMWIQIMDLIMKSLLSVEPVISARTKITAPYSQNCFELYGFDVLVDSQLKPWLLEVNLSPSMQAESPLDWQIKSSLLADSFNLVGINRVDKSRLAEATRSSWKAAPKPPGKPPGVPERKKNRPVSGRAGTLRPAQQAEEEHQAFNSTQLTSIALGAIEPEDLRAAAHALVECTRSRNFIRLFPTRKTVQHYASITDSQAAMKPRPHGRKPTNGIRLSCSQLLAALLFGPPPNHGSTMHLPTRAAGICMRLPLRSRGVIDDTPGGGEDSSEEDASPSAGTRSPAGSPATRLSSTITLGARSRSSGTFLEKKLVSRGRSVQRKNSLDDTDAAMVIILQDGCRLVMLEYLNRLASVCKRLSAAERARVQGSQSMARLESFRRCLDGRRPSKSGPEQAGADGKQTSESAAEARFCNEDGSSKEDGDYVDRLFASCKASISQLLCKYTGEEPGAHDESLREVGIPLSKLLPISFQQNPERSTALEALAAMGAAELERLLQGPHCDGELKALLEPYTKLRFRGTGIPVGPARSMLQVKRPSSRHGRSRSFTFSASFVAGQPERGKKEVKDFMKDAAGPLSEILWVPLSRSGGAAAAKGTRQATASPVAAAETPGAQSRGGDLPPRTRLPSISHEKAEKLREPSPPTSVASAATAASASSLESQISVAATAAGTSVLSEQLQTDKSGDERSTSRPTSRKASRPYSGYAGSRPLSRAAVLGHTSAAEAMAARSQEAKAHETALPPATKEPTSRMALLEDQSAKQQQQFFEAQVRKSRKHWADFDIEL